MKFTSSTTAAPVCSNCKEITFRGGWENKEGRNNSTSVITDNSILTTGIWKCLLRWSRCCSCSRCQWFCVVFWVGGVRRFLSWRLLCRPARIQKHWNRSRSTRRSRSVEHLGRTPAWPKVTPDGCGGRGVYVGTFSYIHVNNSTPVIRKYLTVNTMLGRVGQRIVCMATHHLTNRNCIPTGLVWLFVESALIYVPMYR